MGCQPFGKLKPDDGTKPEINCYDNYIVKNNLQTEKTSNNIPIV